MFKGGKYVLYLNDWIARFFRYNLPWLWIVIDYILRVSVNMLRLYAGGVAAKGLDKCKRPRLALKLYEFEGCPFCRKVRETLSCLDLEYKAYPCPRETLSAAGVCLNSRFRVVVKKATGKAQFPYLEDPNTSTQMAESDDIIKYLWATYGSEAEAPWNYALAFNKSYLEWSMSFCAFLRPCTDMGVLRAASLNPAKNFELWGAESCASAKGMRETLTTLELPFDVHPLPWGTLRTKDAEKDHPSTNFLRSFSNGLRQHHAFLRDPNTGETFTCASKATKYLIDKYQTAQVPAETWLDKK